MSEHRELAIRYFNAAGYDREADLTRKLLAEVDDTESRDLVAGQLDSITAPA